MSRDRFYECIKDYKYVKKGDILVDSLYWTFRTVILATPKYKTKIITDRKAIYPIELDYSEYFKKLSLQDIKYLIPHFNKKLEIDLNLEFRDSESMKLTDYCCRNCGQLMPDEFYYGNSIYKLEQKKGFISKCKMCNTEKILLFSKGLFQINAFNENLFNTIKNGNILSKRRR